MGDQMRAELAVDAVSMAVWNRRPQAGAIHHSDHRSQYTALAFGKTLFLQPKEAPSVEGHFSFSIFWQVPHAW